MGGLSPTLDAVLYSKDYKILQNRSGRPRKLASPGASGQYTGRRVQTPMTPSSRDTRGDDAKLGG